MTTKEPIHILSLGAGVQSSTMALMAAHGEITPWPDYAIFADTQAEPTSVYKWLDWLETQLPFPLHRVTKGSLADSVMDLRTTKDGRLFSKTNIPFFTRNDDGSKGMISHRSCTADYKIGPIVAETRALVGDDLRAWRRAFKTERSVLTVYRKEAAAAKREKRGVAIPFPHEEWDRMQDNALVVQWIGISTDEATRMKPSREPWIRNRWPLIEQRVSRKGCIDWMQSNEYPEPPRSACIFCPYHDNHEWRRLKTDEPEEFQRAVEFEIALQKGKAASQNFKTVPYLHASRQPLESVDFSTLAERNGQLNMFENECEGMCGL